MRMLWISAGYLLALLFALPAQAQAEIPESLQQTYGKFATALVKGEADKAIDFYVEDAVVLVDAQHVYRGRSAILEDFLQVYLEPPAGEEEPGTDIEVDRVVVGEGAVTLAGRYSSPAGTSGVYSNTWRRQDDGNWKLAISVMTFEATESTQASSEEAFACTQVLGFSQSLEWYGGAVAGARWGSAGISLAGDRGVPARVAGTVLSGSRTGRTGTPTLLE